MAFSKATLKNLFDLMQKVSLTITVVSIALLSNIVLVLSHPVVEEKAKPELARLMQFRNKIGELTPRQIVEKSVMAEYWNDSEIIDPEDSRLVEEPGISRSIDTDMPYAEISASLLSGLIPVTEAILRYPLAFFESADPDWNKKFKDANSLNEMRRLWNSVSVVNSFWELDRPKQLFLSMPDLSEKPILGYTPLNSPGNVTIPLPALLPDGQPKLIHKTKLPPYTAIIELQYNLSPIRHTFGAFFVKTLEPSGLTPLYFM